MIVKGVNEISFSQETVVTLGTFDGVHRGHQALLDKVRRVAQAEGLKTVVFTFPQPPQNHCNGKPRKRLILPTAKKLELLEASGIDAVIVVEFQDVAGLSPKEFAQQILKNRLNTAEVVVGYDCRFGKGRAGDTETLRTLGRELGLGVSVLEPVVVDGVVVSSTEIRKAIQNGDVRRAARLLGYTPFISGRVTEEEASEKAFGSHTMSLNLPDGIVTPDEGDFIITACLPAREEPGVVHVHQCISPKENNRSFELQLFNSELKVLTGASVEIKLLNRLGDERDFCLVCTSKKRLGAGLELMSNFVRAISAA